jgi:hypothetical protein
VADDSETKGKRATALTWVKNPVPGTMATHPGVYCLRSNEMAWDEERLWRTYTRLTDRESVFRSLKSELGLRPVFHQKEDRADGPLFITVLAYQCVQGTTHPTEEGQQFSFQTSLAIEGRFCGKAPSTDQVP